MNKLFAKSAMTFIAAAGITVLLSSPKTSFADKDLRYSGRNCTFIPLVISGFKIPPHDSPTDRFFTCPWDDSTDFRASSVSVLNIELEAGSQGEGKACIDFWGTTGGECGPGMGNNKTLEPLLDEWVADNSGHFKYLGGTVVVPVGTLLPIKGVFAYIP